MLTQSSPNNCLPFANAFPWLRTADRFREFRKHSILRARSIFLLELVKNEDFSLPAWPSNSQMQRKCKIFASAALCEESCKLSRHSSRRPNICLVLHLSFVNCHIFQTLQICWLLSGWYGHAATNAHFYIFTSHDKTRKSCHTNLVFTGSSLLVQCWVPMFGGTQQCLFDPRKQTFTRSHATHLVFCQYCQHPCMCFCGDTEEWLCNSGHGCTEVDGNCYVRLIFQTHASSPSTQMWKRSGRGEQGSWVQQNVSVKCFNWLRWTQFVEDGGCVATKSQCFLGTRGSGR